VVDEAGHTPFNANLVIFDTVSQQEQATIPFDASVGIPSAAAITPDGQYLYLIATKNPNAVLMVSTTTNTVDATISVALGANAMAIAPSGNYAYVASSTGNEPGSVTVIDISSN
jgi:DNA-binding beta-propeller fold protein YncE